MSKKSFKEDILGSVLLISIIGASIWFYISPWPLTDHKLLSYYLLLVIAAIFPLDNIIRFILVYLKLINKQEYQKAEFAMSMARLAVNGIVLAVLWLLYFLKIIPPQHVPWILFISLFATTFLVEISVIELRKQRSYALLKYFVITICGTALVWLQIIIVDHFDTWLIILIGVIPIPVLGITMGITAIASIIILNSILLMFFRYLIQKRFD